jgi:competence ComEA-like helix-hairpin-helix protein
MSVSTTISVLWRRDVQWVLIGLCLLLLLRGAWRSDAKPPDRVEPMMRLRLSVNEADATALATLPGVGPQLASRIVAFRQSRGELASVDELLEVRGVGNQTLARIRPYLQVRRRRNEPSGATAVPDLQR